MKMGEWKYFCFAAYVLIKFFTGVIVNSFGPIVIYFTKVTHLDETYYSFIFLAKAVGYLIGGLLAKVLVKHISFHRVFAIAIIICGSALIVSSVNFGFWNLAITMVFIGGSCCILEIVSNICVFEIFFKDHQDYWFQLLNLFFPIGGLVGPLIILQTEQLGLRAIGILLFLCLTPVLLLNSPEKENKSIEQAQSREKQLQISTHIEIGLCSLIFIFFGFAMFYPSWEPTYAMKTGVFSEKQANTLASIYWIVNILSKVFFLFLRNSVQTRIFFQLKGLFVCGLITIVLQLLGYYTLVCYFGVITISFFVSGLYPLFYAIAPEHGYKLSPSNLANLTIFTCLGEGLLVTPIGYLMGLLGYRAFIYFAFVIGCIVFGIFAYTNNLMIIGKSQEEYQQIQN